MLEATASALTGVLGGLGWMGPASAAHATLTGAQGAMTKVAVASLGQQASVISVYSDVLRAAQRKADRAIELARDADRRIRAAEADIQQAQDDQSAAKLRITLARDAQALARTQMVTAVADAVLGDNAAARAADAAAEEADASRDLDAAKERERQARRRLEAAEDDRREAQEAGDEAEDSVALARTGLIGAAQAAGLLPTQPGGPANAAFAAAAGIRLPEPPRPDESEDKSWLERRLDEVGQAGSWAWDQAGQVPGGVWEGTKGIYEGGKFLFELNPSNPQNLLNPKRTFERYEQLARTGQYAWENPGEFGKQLINWEDLAAGRYGEWAGNLVPDALLAVGTAGAGTAAARSARVARTTERLAKGGAGPAFHYTFRRAIQSIENEGLRRGSYATPNGDLSPLQAQIDLALPPNRGLRDAVVRVDLDGLRKAGYEVPELRQVGRKFNMPGGGREVQFPYPIPPQFLTVVRP